MKRLLLLTCFCFIVQYIFAASASIDLPSDDSSVIASKKNIAINRDEQILVYSLCNNLSIKEYQKLSGKKLNLAQKVEYFLIRHKIIKPKPDDKSLIKLGGLMLGYLLGPVGVLIAFIIPKNKELRCWSIIGFGALVVTILILLLTFQIPIGGNWNWNWM